MASKIFLIFIDQNGLQIRHLHDLTPQQCQSNLLQYLQYGLIEYDVVVFDLIQVIDEFVYLLFADLESVVEFFVHYFAQLELFRWAQVVEWIFRLIENLLLSKNGVPVLERILQKASEFIFLTLFLPVEFVHLEEEDAGLGEFKISIAMAVGKGSDSPKIFFDFGFLDLSQEVTHIIGRFGSRSFSRSTTVHLSLLLIDHFPQMFAFAEKIISLLFILIFHLMLVIFGGACKLIISFGVAKRQVFEFVDALIHFMYHFAQFIPEGGVFVDQDLFGLVFEQVLNSRDMDFFAVFVLLLDLGDVQSQGFQSAGVQLLFCCDFLQPQTSQAELSNFYFRYCQRTYFFKLSLALEVQTDILTAVSSLQFLSSSGKGSTISILDYFLRG